MSEKKLEKQFIKANVEAKDNGEIQMIVFSDESEDRMGDTINSEGWVLDSFKRNPVLLWAHDAAFEHSIPAIGNVKNIRITKEGKLIGKLDFDMEDEFARKVYNKYKNGILSATSVGFLPLEYEQKSKGGYEFQKQELLEVSCVNVPANRNALTQLRQMKGMENQAELMQEFLDKHEKNSGSKEDEKIEKSPTCRQEGESKEDCVDRKIPEIMEENPDMEQDQAVAIASSMCEEPCSEQDSQEDKVSNVESVDISKQEANEQLVERLNKIANDMENAVNQLRGIVEQSSKEDNKSVEDNPDVAAVMGAMYDLVEVLRIADKANETAMKKFKQLRKSSSKSRGGE